MHNDKAGVAIFVESRMKPVNAARPEDPWQEGYLFGGHFESIGASLGYLNFLEKRNTHFIVQIGFVGYSHGEVK